MGYLKTGFCFLNALLKTRLVCTQCNPISISFSFFVVNNSKTAARVVAVCEICMSTAAIKRGRGNVDVNRLRFHAAMIDVVRSSVVRSCHNGN